MPIIRRFCDEYFRRVARYCPLLSLTAAAHAPLDQPEIHVAKTYVFVDTYALRLVFATLSNGFNLSVV